MRTIRGPLFRSTTLLSPALLIRLTHPDHQVSVTSLWLLFAEFLVFLQFAWAVNDHADRDHDLASGKVRAIALLPSWARIGLIAFLGAIDLAIALFLDGWGPHVLLLFLGLLLAAAYSLEPIRLKERGISGLIFPAIFGRVIPCLLACELYGVLPWWMLAIILSEFIKTASDLLFHQIVDFEADRAVGATTFVQAYGRAEAVQLLRWGAYVGTAAFVAVGAVMSLIVPAYRWVFASALALAWPMAVASRRYYGGRHGTELTRLVPLPYLWFGFSVHITGPFWLGLFVAAREPPAVPLCITLGLITVAQTAFYARYSYR